jgi:hypothetical protein
MSSLVDISWSQLGFDIDGEASGDRSGFSVSLSADGTVVAIGATDNDGTDSDAGHVRVYKYDPTKLTAVTDQNSVNFGPVGWTRLGGDIDGEAAGDESGFSVSLSADGTVVAIGANRNDGTSGTNRGHVRVYKYDPTKLTAVTDQNSVNFGPVGWTRLGGDIDGEAADDRSGTSVSLSADGTVVAIGANRNDDNGTSSGHVRVYKYYPNKLTAVTDQTDASFGPVGWTRLGQDIDGEADGDRSGIAVSLSADGTVVAIGADRNAGNGTEFGHVRVYKYYPTKLTAVTDQNSVNFGPVGWTRLGGDIDGEANFDGIGNSVSLSADGTIVAIGASLNRSGYVCVYKYDVNKLTAVTDQTDASFGPVGWTRLGGDIDGEAAGDQSGFSVSLSADGTIIAIGARYNSGTDYDAGHVRVYKYDANKVNAETDQSNPNFGPVGWTRLGLDIDGEADYNESGFSVSLSAHGTVLAIGARSNDGTTGNITDNTGHVRIYKLNGLNLDPISNICFPAGTPINTDQGIIAIDKINPSINTIRGNKIETITKTVTEDKYLVCIEKDALSKNIPSEKTLITKNHELFYNGIMIKARELLNLKNDKIYKVKYNGETLYNILLEKHDKMIVNNLICETLNPENGIARMYNDLKSANYNELKKFEFIKEYNNYVKNNKTFMK